MITKKKFMILSFYWYVFPSYTRSSKIPLEPILSNFQYDKVAQRSEATKVR